MSSVVGKCSNAYGVNIILAECQVVPNIGGGSFQQHAVSIHVIITCDGSRTINYELKNITKSVVIDSGTITLSSAHKGYEFNKTIQITANYVGDTINFKAWESGGLPVAYLFIVHQWSTVSSG